MSLPAALGARDILGLRIRSVSFSEDCCVRTPFILLISSSLFLTLLSSEDLESIASLCGALGLSEVFAVVRGMRVESNTSTAVQEAGSK